MTENDHKDIFEQWTDRYRNLMYKIVRSYAFTSMDREDLFQDISIQVWKSIPSFRNECAPTTWIYRIALNVAIRNSTRDKRRSSHSLNIENIKEPVIEESNVIKDDRLTWLYDEISKLEGVDKPIALLLLDGLSYKEMASIIGISESNIGVRINRIKKQLTNRSEKYERHGI